MGKSAFNKLAEQYIVTKNAVNKEVSRQLEIRTDLTTDAEAIEDISAKIDSELSHKLNFSFLYMIQKEGVDMHNFIEEAEVLAQQVIDKFPPSLAVIC